MEFPFTDAAFLLDTLTSHGYEAYVVGGAVRDYLLGRPVHDVDIATSAHPDDVISLFKRTVPTGIRHGTITVIYRKRSYEVTTFRSEADYYDFRHPGKVTFETSLDKDLMRRDFTINALAMERTGRIIDLFGGTEDMSLKRIRMVGSPAERITEDPLRIMRGIRFVSELNFNLGSDEQAAFSEKATLLRKISVERIEQEMTRLLDGPARAKAIKLLFTTGCLYALPLIKNKTAAVEPNQVDFSVLATNDERWTAFLLVLGFRDIAEFAREWKWPGARRKAVARLQYYFEQRKREPWSQLSIYIAGLRNAQSVERLLCAFGRIRRDRLSESLDRINRIWASCRIHSRSELAVNGRDLLTWSDARQGPWMKEALDQIEQNVVTGRIANDREAIESWFRTWQAKLKKRF
ncbi:CCA tRNA nucleotidyltransferase [Sporolactobacillus sp. THM19-2]|uniref:CCA tRNA nucleotidyltransferase n=1 Tax=Sporolactobacillus sp. THM19-2 TaxID=2511171 RepID=UPI00101F122F|nr:CCA tRNA nucleotidyltransferase [Sporolactobacillus sp. THM19-2]RYL93309.1 CCA tRNA nucleotidyltransferase [Sporolactobacillus sp. THM19-2]